jgi:hypothetical protein
MRKRLAGLTWLFPMLLSGCGAPQAANVGQPAPPSLAASATPTANIPASLPAPVSENRVVSRTIDQDLDADGINDSRIIITESFDAAGMLISRTREEDFEADGIIDVRVTTVFDD